MPRTPAGQASAARERYVAYKKLCRQHDVKPRWGDWSTHCHELLQLEPPFRRLTRAEHYAFWTERLTPREIREIGACLDFLGRDQVAA